MSHSNAAANENSVSVAARSVIRTVIRKVLKQSQISLISSAGGLLLGSATAAAQSQAPTATDAQASEIQEVVVTAQRRSQSVQDIPYNITAVDAHDIASSGATSINDLTRLVPGLTTVDEGTAARGRNNNLTLRGLRTDAPGGGGGAPEVPGQAVSSVSTYFGETPVFFPMPLYDIERVEVLRGPQGTLYGSGAQAGTIRFVPRRPDFESFSGNVEVTGSSTDHSGDWNRDANVVVNLPIAEHLAARVVAGGKHDGGFIDAADLYARDTNGAPIPSVARDLTSGPVLLPVRRDANATNEWFGRAALRWQPAQEIDLQIDYLRQQIHSSNSQISNPGFAGGPFDITTPVPGPVTPANPPHYANSTVNLRPGGRYTSTSFFETPYQDKIDLISAVVTGDLGFATVTSATSYDDDRSFAVGDYTAPFYLPTAPFNYNSYPPYLFYPRFLSIVPAAADARSFIQEVRLVSSGDNRIDYVIGAYYQRESTSALLRQSFPGIQDYLTFTGQPNPSTYGDTAYILDRHSRFTDLAGFSEVTGHITHQWQITGGLRVFRQTSRTSGTIRLPLCGAVCSSDLINPIGLSVTSAQAESSRVIKKLNTSYDLTERAKVYFTYSEGFRRGGTNALPVAGSFASLPAYQSYSPDIAKNYEVGIKGTLLERRIRYSADVFRIDLNNFQFDTLNLSSNAVTLNGRKARSQGAELELQAAFGQGGSATLGYTYTDAKVTESFDLLDYVPYALVPSLGGTGATASVLGGGLKTGYKLPGVPAHTLTVSIEQAIPLKTGSHTVTLTPHIDGSYRSSSVANISPTSIYNWTIPSYFIGNARLTLDIERKLAVDLFVNNLSSNPGYSGDEYVQVIPNYARYRNVTRPRTVGLSLRYNFK